MGGSNTVPYVQGQLSGQPGVYGTQGTPAPDNTPGWRTYPVGWADNNGNLWLFGGLTFSSASQFNYLNDLWKFDTATGQWTWMNGSSSPGSNCLVGLTITSCGRTGAYGTVGTPATGNTPGGRAHAAAWVDSSGNFWLYGGAGFDAAGNSGALGDLWRFNPSTNQWTWMGGSSTVPVNSGCNCTLGPLPVPGTLGIAAPGNTPGGLWMASSWTDHNGNLWLFSGWGYTPTGYASVPNDVWQFNPSSNEWAWMGGDSNFGTSALHGTYGDLGKFAAGNIPGPRWDTATWTDANGNLWLFGGEGDAAIVTEGFLNDLWEFNPSMNQWAWMGGSSTVDRPGVYGTLGVPAASNIPGSRMAPFNWRDINGNLWLFGGQGFDANSNSNTLNDLWKFNPSTNQWAWMGGLSTLTNVPTGAGVYGILGTPSASNQPGRRYGGVSWTDKKGNFWLWGGVGLDAAFTYGYLNDLWVYQPASPDFTISGTPVSITAGATTGNTSTITVTPTGGFTGSVTLVAALTSSPSGAVMPPTFSFNSTSPLNITGNAAGAVTLTVVTTASSPPCTSINQIPGGGPWYAGSGAALASLFLFVIPKRSRKSRSILSLVFSFTALVGGVVGCSGTGGGAACPNVIVPGTTAGTYVITVTATSGATTKTGAVSVIVQ